MAEARSFDEALGRVVRIACRSLGWPVGHVYRPAGEPTDQLVSAGIWHVEDEARFRTLREASDRVDFQPWEGPIGRAWSEGRPVWIENVSNVPGFARLRGEDVGVGAGIVVPVTIGGEIAAILEFYSEEPRSEDPGLVETFSALGALLWTAHERERALVRARRRERRLAILLEHAEEVFTLLDGTGAIVSHGPGWRRTLGYEDHDARYRTPFSIVHPEDRRAVEELFSKSLERPGERVGPVEARVRDADGTWRSGLSSVVNLLEESAVGAVIVNWLDDAGPGASDMRAVAELERKRHRARRMEAIGQLAGGIAHDFNNVLTAIRGYADLIADDLPEGLEKARSGIEEIRKATGRAGRLTRQILAYTRQQLMQPKVVEINAIVAEMRTMIERLIGDDIEIVTRPEPSAGRVRVDPGQLEQVLLNLAVNARDAMPEGGRLVIETRGIELEEPYLQREFAVEPGEYAVLTVSDTGTGMDAETRARVFEPFFTTREEEGGTGLGLATVYGIVKQSGGYIWVYSEPGEGTTFRIYLPRHSGEPVAAPRRRFSGARRGGGETVLAVEDDVQVLGLIARVLRERGYRVLEAEDGDVALAAAEGHDGAIDLLFTDVVVPGRDGREVAAELRERIPGLKVVYTSGFAGRVGVTELAEQEADAPGVAFLSKPFTPAELAYTIRETLDTG